MLEELMWQEEVGSFTLAVLYIGGTHITALDYN